MVLTRSATSPFAYTHAGQRCCCPQLLVTSHQLGTVPTGGCSASGKAFGLIQNQSQGPLKLLQLHLSERAERAESSFTASLLLAELSRQEPPAPEQHQRAGRQKRPPSPRQLPAKPTSAPSSVGLESPQENTYTMDVPSHTQNLYKTSLLALQLPLDSYYILTQIKSKYI